MKNVSVYDGEKDKLKHVIVNVTARDIVKGIRGECIKCPVALAVNRLLKKPYQATVGFITIYYKTTTNFEGVHGPLMPENVGAFIRTFDNRSPPAPFKFKMYIPKIVLRHP